MRKVLLMALFMANTAFAGSNVETLKTLYEAASSPARVQDFPEQEFSDYSFVSPPRNQCVIINEDDEPYKFPIANVIRRTKAYGPLVFEKTNERLVFGEDIQALFVGAGEHVERTATDMVVTQSAYRTWENVGVKYFTPATMYVRKLNDTIVFKIAIVYNNPEVLDQVWHGYCYNLGENHEKR